MRKIRVESGVRSESSAVCRSHGVVIANSVFTHRAHLYIRHPTPISVLERLLHRLEVRLEALLLGDRAISHDENLARDPLHEILVMAD